MMSSFTQKPGKVALSAVEAITTETVHVNSRDCDDDDDLFEMVVRRSLR